MQYCRVLVPDASYFPVVIAKDFKQEYQSFFVININRRKPSEMLYIIAIYNIGITMNNTNLQLRETQIFGIDFFELKTRIGRIRYLGLTSFWTALIFVSGACATTALDSHYLIRFMAVMIFISSAVNMLFLKIRRLNDFNFSGWWLLICAIPFIGIIIWLIFLCIPGDKAENRFGQVPPEAHLRHYIMLFIIPLLILSNYLGVYELILKNIAWKRYDNHYYSIEFPLTPKSLTKQEPTPGNRLQLAGNNYALFTDYIDLSKLSEQQFLQFLSYSQPNDLMDMPALELLNILIGDEIPLKDIKIISDKVISSISPLEREMVLSAEFEGTPVSGRIKFIMQDKVVIEVYGFALKPNHSNKQIVARFIDSFKLKQKSE